MSNSQRAPRLNSGALGIPTDPYLADSIGTEDPEFEEFMAELTRVCPEAIDGLAIGGPPPPPLSQRQLIDLLRTLPDNAGLDGFLNAWYNAHAT